MTATETVTRIRPTTTGGTDAFDQPVAGTPTETAITGALVDPGNSSEPVEAGRTPVVTTPKVYFRGAFPDIVEGDQLRVRDVIYDVDGEPEVWRRGTQAGGGLVVNLRNTGG